MQREAGPAFKTGEPARAGWRVRFPSASATCTNVPRGLVDGPQRPCSAGPDGTSLATGTAGSGSARSSTATSTSAPEPSLVTDSVTSSTGSTRGFAGRAAASGSRTTTPPPSPTWSRGRGSDPPGQEGAPGTPAPGAQTLRRMAELPCRTLRSPLGLNPEVTAAADLAQSAFRARVLSRTAYPARVADQADMGGGRPPAISVQARRGASGLGLP